MAVRYRNIVLMLGIVVLLAAVAILTTRRSVRGEFIAGNNLRRIVIERLQDTTEILIDRENIIVNPGEYRGDSTAINGLVAQLKLATLGEVISERKESHRDFEVGDGALRVTLGGDPPRSFYVGKQAIDYKHTYVRFTGEDRVYLAKGISRLMFDRNPDEWRDRQILTFDMYAVDALVVGDNEFVKQDSLWFLREQQVEHLRMTEILNLLSNLQASGFAEDVRLLEPLLRISIVSDAFTHEIEIGERREQFFYLLRVNDRKPVYLVNEYIVDLIRGLSAGS